MGLMIGPGIGIIVQNVWDIKSIFFWYTCTCFLSFLILIFGIEKEGVNKEIQPKTTSDIRYYYTLISNKKIAVVLFGISLYGAGYGALVTIIPDYLISYRSFSNNYTGLFFTLIYVAIGIAQFITGPLTDKYGPKIFMKIGLITASIGIFFFSHLEFQWNIITSLTLASFGLGIFHLSSLCFINDTVSHSKKGSISGLYYFFWGIGIFWGPLIVEKLGKLLGIEIGYAIFAFALLTGAFIMMVLDKITDKEVLESAIT
jgi:MFS family permease